MKLSIVAAVVVVAMGRVGGSPLSAQARPTTAVIPACSLMSKEEVKQHLPWPAMLDQFPAEEEAMGNYGSACEYPSVRVQVIPFAQGTIDELKKRPGIEAIRGVGDEAYLHNNRNRYAELYVKVGTRALTLQASIKESIDDVKPGVVEMAKALVAKLR